MLAPDDGCFKNPKNVTDQTINIFSDKKNIQLWLTVLVHLFVCPSDGKAVLLLTTSFRLSPMLKEIPLIFGPFVVVPIAQPLQFTLKVIRLLQTLADMKYVFTSVVQWKLRYSALDYPERPVKLSCIKCPFYFTIQTAGSMIIRRTKYWRLIGLFMLFIGRVTLVVMKRK